MESRVKPILLTLALWAGRHVAEAFETGLREHGWEPGRNPVVEHFYTDARPELLPQRAAEALARKPDVAGLAPALVAKNQQLLRGLVPQARRIDALHIWSDNLIWLHRGEIVAAAPRHRWPALYGFS